MKKKLYMNIVKITNLKNNSQTTDQTDQIGNTKEDFVNTFKQFSDHEL